MRRVRISEGRLMWTQVGDEPWSPFESRVGRVIFRVSAYHQNRWEWGAYDAFLGTKLGGPVFNPPNFLAERYWWRTYEFAMKQAEEFYIYLKERRGSTPPN